MTVTLFFILNKTGLLNYSAVLYDHQKNNVKKTTRNAFNTISFFFQIAFFVVAFIALVKRRLLNRPDVRFSLSFFPHYNFMATIKEERANN